jgi:hypothetical protein
MHPIEIDATLKLAKRKLREKNPRGPLLIPRDDESKTTGLIG